jgi:deoxyribose-phosphate aldolase
MQIAPYIDHTYLKPDCTEVIIDRLMEEASKYGFKAICIPPMYVEYAKEKAGDRNFLLCTVAGFPIGYDHESAKLASIRRSAEVGADEVDVVINLSAIKNGHFNLTKREMTAFHETGKACGITMKYIIEAQLLTEEELLRICDISNELGLDFVKTSTGFFGEPVKEDIVRLLRKHLNPSIHIKASGGISQYFQAVNMIRAGADRLGCSQGVNMVKETVQDS